MTPLLAALSALLVLAAAGLPGRLPGRLPAHKKYFIGSTNQKNMKLVNERAADSYFRILKSAPKSYIGLPLGGRRYTPVGRNGGGRPEPPMRPRNVEDHLRHETLNPAEASERTLDLREPTATATPLSKPDREERPKLKQYEYFRNNNFYQKPGRSGSNSLNSQVEPNVHKFTRDLNDRRLRPEQNFHQKVRPSSRVKDKILHKANVNDGRKERLTARRFGRVAQRPTDRDSHKETEYRKRHALDTAASERERYVGPSGRTERTHGVIGRYTAPSGIGGHDGGREVRDPPYALFYRTNREDSERPEWPAGDDPAAAFYSGRVTGYAARGGTESIGAIDDRTKLYSAFPDR